MAWKKGACPIETLMSAIGGKYKIVILHYLMDGTRRFGELQRLLPGVSQRMLTQHLRELERDQLVSREVYRQIPPRVEYSLTELGRSLQPVLAQMNAWVEQYVTGETLSEMGRSEKQATPEGAPRAT